MDKTEEKTVVAVLSGDLLDGDPGCGNFRQECRDTVKKIICKICSLAEVTLLEDGKVSITIKNCTRKKIDQFWRELSAEWSSPHTGELVLNID